MKNAEIVSTSPQNLLNKVAAFICSDKFPISFSFGLSMPTPTGWSFLSDCELIRQFYIHGYNSIDEIFSKNTFLLNHIQASIPSREWILRRRDLLLFEISYIIPDDFQYDSRPVCFNILMQNASKHTRDFLTRFEMLKILRCLFFRGFPILNISDSLEIFIKNIDMKDVKKEAIEEFLLDLLSFSSCFIPFPYIDITPNFCTKNNWIPYSIFYMIAGTLRIHSQCAFTCFTKEIEPISFIPWTYKVPSFWTVKCNFILYNIIAVSGIMVKSYFSELLSAESESHIFAIERARELMLYDPLPNNIIPLLDFLSNYKMLFPGIIFFNRSYSESHKQIMSLEKFRANHKNISFLDLAIVRKMDFQIPKDQINDPFYNWNYFLKLIKNEYNINLRNSHPRNGIINLTNLGQFHIPNLNQKTVKTHQREHKILETPSNKKDISIPIIINNKTFSILENGFVSMTLLSNAEYPVVLKFTANIIDGKTVFQFSAFEKEKIKKISAEGNDFMNTYLLFKVQYIKAQSPYPQIPQISNVSPFSLFNIKVLQTAPINEIAHLF